MLVQAQKFRRRYRDAVLRLFDGVDAILAPATPSCAPLLGQKTFVAKMAAKFNIPLIFYGEMPGEYGEKISHKTSSYAGASDVAESEGFSLDYLGGRDIRGASATALRALVRLDPALARGGIDLERSYTNEFVRQSRQRFHT